MRYELYSCIEVFDTPCYRFEMECDEMDRLLTYVLLTTNKWSHDHSFAERQWLFLDNEPCEYLPLRLGYTQIPKQESCLSRIYECKLMKQLQQKGYHQTALECAAYFPLEYQVCSNKAREESVVLGEKLFQYPPNMDK